MKDKLSSETTKMAKKIVTEFDLKNWQEGGISSFSQTCFAEYWDSLPDIHENSHVDPYSFRGRMTLGKCIIEKTGKHDKASNHWFWGYLTQLDWQWRSGRLSSQSNDNEVKEREDAISGDSWFGYMNLNFCVSIYQAAEKVGLVPRVIFIGSHKDFVENNAGYLACVGIWRTFWEDSHKEYVNKFGKPGTEKALVTLYSELWLTHTHILKASLPNAKEMEAILPELERNFGQGWCHTVELLAAMRYTLLTLHALMENGAGYLPTRILNEDSLSWLKENREDEYNAACEIIGLQTATPEKLSMICGFYRRLTNWEWERQQMPKTAKLLRKGSSLQKSVVLMRILLKVMLPNSALEIALWNFILIVLVAVAYSTIRT